MTKKMHERIISDIKVANAMLMKVKAEIDNSKFDKIRLDAKPIAPKKYIAFFFIFSLPKILKINYI